MTWLTGSIEGVNEANDIEVVADSEKESYTNGGWGASVTLRVPWDYRHDILANILNNRLDWPYRTGLGMRAASGSVQSMKGTRTQTTDNKNAYPKADLVIGFLRPSFGGGTGFGAPGGGAGNYLFHETIEASGEMLKLPPSGIYRAADPYTDEAIDVEWQFKWGQHYGDSANVTPEEAPTKLVGGFDYVVRWEGLPTVPTAILGMKDHVNADPIVSSTLGLTFDEETLLNTGVTINRSGTTMGTSTAFDLEVRFSHRVNGWNKFYDVVANEWKKMWIHISTPSLDDYEAYEYNNFPTTALMGDVLP